MSLAGGRVATGVRPLQEFAQLALRDLIKEEEPSQMYTTKTLGAIAASILMSATATANDIDAPREQAQKDANPMAQFDDETARLSVPEAQSIAPKKSAHKAQKNLAKAAAESRGLKADTKNEAEAVMVCRKVKSITGSRLGRKRCSTVQEMERNAKIHSDNYQRSSNQMKRAAFDPTGSSRVRDRSKPKF